jgi:RNA polymerase sigma factor (sigma-70 family)
MSISDEEVWAGVLTGRGHAFGEVFDRHGTRLYRHSRGLASSWSDADDIVAVTFLEAWRKRDDIRFVDGSMLPWLLRTATYTASNLTRASRRHKAALQRLPPGDTQPDHSEQFEDGEAVTALRKLSPIDQQILTLCVLEGISAEDAARVMGVRHGTVKSRLSRATARLRESLSEPTTALRPEGATHVL